MAPKKSNNDAIKGLIILAMIVIVLSTEAYFVGSQNAWEEAFDAVSQIKDLTSAVDAQDAILCAHYGEQCPKKANCND